MLYDVTILEPSISFHYDHMTVIVSYDCDIILDPTPRLSRSKKKDLICFIFPFIFYFLFDLFFYFLFLEQLGLGLICHTVTSVTI